MFVFKNKVVIITGGANGIGAAIVKAILNEDIKQVSALDIDEVSGIALQNECNKLYGDNKVKFIKCDVTVDEQLFGAFKTVANENGHIDVIINNAASADETNMAAVRKQIEINYIAVVNSTLEAIDMMRVDQGGKGGTIVNISSVCAISQISPTIFVYAASKTAILQFSNCIGMENYSSMTGIRVLAVAFNKTNTDMLGKMSVYDKSTENTIKDYFKTFPVQTAEAAALGVIQAMKEGKSGSTWLVSDSKTSEITDAITKAYGIMAETILS